MTDSSEFSSPTPGGAYGEALLVFALGVALLIVGRNDLRTYLASRDHPGPSLTLVDHPGEPAAGSELYRRGLTVVALDNVSNVESNAGGKFRHSLGPAASLEIRSDRPVIRLHFRYFNAIDGQTLTVTYNGKELEHLEKMPQGFCERRYSLDVVPGPNRFSIGFERYNHHGAELSAADDRLIAGDFTALDIQLD